MKEKERKKKRKFTYIGNVLDVIFNCDKQFVLFVFNPCSAKSPERESVTEFHHSPVPDSTKICKESKKKGTHKE